MRVALNAQAQKHLAHHFESGANTLTPFARGESIARLLPCSAFVQYVQAAHLVGPTIGEMDDEEAMALVEAPRPPFVAQRTRNVVGESPSSLAAPLMQGVREFPTRPSSSFRHTRQGDRFYSVATEMSPYCN